MITKKFKIKINSCISFRLVRGSYWKAINRPYTLQFAPSQNNIEGVTVTFYRRNKNLLKTGIAEQRIAKRLDYRWPWLLRFTLIGFYFGDL